MLYHDTPRFIIKMFHLHIQRLWSHVKYDTEKNVLLQVILQTFAY